MFSSHALLSFLLITLTAVDASPVSLNTSKATLRFTTKLNDLGSLSIVEKDRARVQALEQAGHLGKRSMPEVGVTNTMIGYIVNVGFGSPPTFYELVLDTGSSNTWVGANKSYVQTKTSQKTGKFVSVKYGSGNFTGEEWIDTLTLSSSLVIDRQSIGVANSSNRIPFDGILGVGPVDLTNHTVSGSETIPTVMDNLLSQRTISEEALGIYFIPATETTKEGVLTFGGYDESAIVGPMTYVSLARTPSPRQYWSIEQLITYGNDTIMLPSKGIVDTGTTLIYIPTDAFEKYRSKTGATYDSATQLYKITCEQYDNLKPLIFHIGNKPYKLTPNAQIWPRALNNATGGSSDSIYLIVQPFKSTHHIDFIIGYTFLERFYSVYDTTRGAVGFAKTKYTYLDIN